MTRPTYELEDQKDGHHFEGFPGMKLIPVQVRSLCGGAIRFLLGVRTEVRLKETGFHKTDGGLSQNRREQGWLRCRGDDLCDTPPGEDRLCCQTGCAAIGRGNP